MNYSIKINNLLQQSNQEKEIKIKAQEFKLKTKQQINGVSVNPPDRRCPIPAVVGGNSLIVCISCFCM